MSAAPALAPAIAALRTGRPVQLVGDARLAIASVETAINELLTLLDPAQSAPLLLSGERAAALSLGNIREAADPAKPVLIARQAWLDRSAALALVDPGRDLDRVSAGPLAVLAIKDHEGATAALSLARLAGLLPALWVLDDAPGAIEIAVDAVRAARPSVSLIARAALPIDSLPDSQIASFRGDDDGADHVALIVGAFGGRPPLVRLHSECLTGDVFGSLKCDCGPQLKQALRIIGDAGGGVLLYLRQEGRGIGLPNKIRAYQLQDRGLDTVDANRRLGFADDERDYGHAAAMLRALGISEVRLLTNNPAKVAGLEAAGIRVIERVAHHMPANPHNADYLATKQSRSGHLT